MKLDEPGRLCHEGKGGNGWRMLNEVTQEDEICICPVVFERTATSNTLSSLPNTKESLKGRHIDDIKRYYAAGTLLHEISHCSTILGADRTRRPFLTIAFESLAELLTRDITYQMILKPQSALTQCRRTKKTAFRSLLLLTPP